MKKRIPLFLIPVLAIACITTLAITDEGQWTPDVLDRLNLRRAGLRIPTSRVFNPGGAGLHEAVLLLGGGTGEFVSSDGLIMTNHHVAFGAVARIATAENDYITDGYYARTPADEIQARGYSARLLQLYEDVTPRVLAGVGDGMTWEERQDAISANARAITQEARAAHPDLDVSISSFSYGNAYKLIGFSIIRDIRIVYVPPFAVGNYGSETDNWMFPRHTGDFSFLRAYVAPDGSPAPYAEENVPYHPRSWLEVAGQAPAEGDFAFLLGYPGTTMRYRDSSFVEYEARSRLPYEIMIRGERIEVMTRAGEGDRAVQIRYAETIKGIANGYKNYQGKVVGFARQDLLNTKRSEEAAWTAWYRVRPELRSRYDGVLEELQEIYAGMERDTPFERTVSELMYSPLQSYAADLYEYCVQMQLPEAERAADFRGDRLARTRNTLLAGPRSFYAPVDEELYTRAAVRALGLPAGRRITPFTEITAGQEITGYGPALQRVARDAHITSPLLDEQGRAELLEADPATAVRRGGLFMAVAADIREERMAIAERQRERNARLARLQQLYAEGIMAYCESQGEMLYPDANRSLRFSYGYVRGYDPRDAVHIRPFTYLTGVLEKETGEGEFVVPDRLRQAWREHDFGPFADASGDVPVNLLTNCDTTGGNSGSPLMNARGELIGINFDRVWEATVNDYNFDPDFGRNISVHMNYLLFICRTFGADRVLRELGF